MIWRRFLIVGLGVICLVVLLVIVKASVDSLQVPPWGNPVGDSTSAEVALDTEIGQHFAAQMSGLYAIELVLDESTSSTPQDVVFHLRTGPNASKDIWSLAFSTASVSTGEPQRFEFEPIASSGGSSYYFFVESPASQPGDAIAVRYSADAELPGTTAYQDDEPLPGSLQFMTFYGPRTREKVEVLLARIADGRPYWFGEPGFYVVLALLFALLLSLYLWQAARIILDEQGGRE